MIYREIYPGHRAEFFSAIPGSESDGVVRFENQVAILKEWIFFDLALTVCFCVD